VVVAHEAAAVAVAEASGRTSSPTPGSGSVAVGTEAFPRHGGGSLLSVSYVQSPTPDGGASKRVKPLQVSEV